jgi:hypothetical protein
MIVYVSLNGSSNLPIEQRDGTLGFVTGTHVSIKMTLKTSFRILSKLFSAIEFFSTLDMVLSLGDGRL